MQQLRTRTVRALWQHISMQASSADPFVSCVGLPNLESTLAASNYALVRSFARQRRTAQTKDKEPASTTAYFDDKTTIFQQDTLEQDLPDRAYRLAGMQSRTCRHAWMLQHRNTQLVLYSDAVLPRSKCGQHLASRKNVSHMLHLSPCHAQAVHGRHGCLAWPVCYTAIYADGARVRDALHTVMVSGNRAYERLVWQLGFTVVEVHAWLQLTIHMHATTLLQTGHTQEAAADAEACRILTLPGAYAVVCCCR